MASFLQVFSLIGARLLRKPTVRLDELVERIAELTGLRTSQVTAVLHELSAALLYYSRRGHGLELPGIGFFRPSLRNDGRVRLLYRPDSGLASELASLDRYRGEVANPENLGLSVQEFKVLWDAEHPDDPMDLPPAMAEDEAA